MVKVVKKNSSVVHVATVGNTGTNMAQAEIEIPIDRIQGGIGMIQEQINELTEKSMPTWLSDQRLSEDGYKSALLDCRATNKAQAAEIAELKADKLDADTNAQEWEVENKELRKAIQAIDDIASNYPFAGMTSQIWAIVEGVKEVE